MRENLSIGTAVPDEDAACARAALALIVAFALARVALAYSLGFGIDEAYTIAISRRLSLSYFDHPPLHQWLAHFSALLLGEGPSMRLPFIALFAGTGWLMFVLTRKLFGARAGVWAVFGLNASAFFLVSAGGWIVPDGPLLFALAAAAIVFVSLFFDELESDAVRRLWLAGGFWLGLAGLSKYSAVLFAFGLVAFIALSPRQRRWFAHPAPYLAALLCVVIVSPVIVWNEENQWISFAFQGVRGAPGAHWRPVQVGAMILGQILWITPWIFIPLAGALIAAARLARRDERRLFLLCLSLPAIALFSLTPLWGAKGLPHWSMPGWFFVYPLLGAWFVEGWARRFNARNWAIASAALLGIITAALVSQAATGWITRALPLPRGAVDPTLEALNWAPLAASPLFNADTAPAFVVSAKWSEGGKIALALGPRMPVIVASDDPRGMAFLDDSARFLGKDAVVIVPQNRLASVEASLQPFFASLGDPQNVTLGRSGADEIDLALIPAHGLTRPFPLPYPRQAASSPSPKALP
ncbi:glycosyltransferase family 39 protein [Methylocapsa sp. S129]|uniref:glycosyltransferase family 39 protein n=1 Tax=Methylocapsa sp. S129 TaxID=1641869 RepID=UPI00131E465F|nr:glycosyltransferase family 39 protein [Methylocapsa sp. S129]